MQCNLGPGGRHGKRSRCDVIDRRQRDVIKQPVWNMPRSRRNRHVRTSSHTDLNTQSNKKGDDISTSYIRLPPT